MPKKGLNVSLQSYDDIFSTEETRQDAQLEKVQQIPLGELHPFKNHPFKVIDDEAMLRTVESIAQFGVLSPAITRPRPEGGYELVSGQRRHHASAQAGLDTMPVIVRDLDDDAAVCLMVDSNLQRESILPSERAFAYTMKLEAMNRRGMRSDLTFDQLGQKFNAPETDDILEYCDIKKAFANSKGYTDAGFEAIDELAQSAMYDPDLMLKKLLEYADSIYDETVN